MGAHFNICTTECVGTDAIQIANELHDQNRDSVIMFFDRVCVNIFILF